MRTLVILSILAVLLVGVFAESYILENVEAEPSENTQRVRRQIGFGGIGVGVVGIGGGYPGYYSGYPYYGGGYGYGGYGGGWGYGRRFHHRRPYYF